MLVIFFQCQPWLHWTNETTATTLFCSSVTERDEEEDDNYSQQCSAPFMKEKRLSRGSAAAEGTTDQHWLLERSLLIRNLLEYRH